MKKHLNIQISGKVQKVGFRFYSMQAAYKYNLKGYSKNMMDGSVLIEAEGEEEDLNGYLLWCKNGPPGSKVTDVKVEEGDIIGFTEFEIR